MLSNPPPFITSLASSPLPAFINLLTKAASESSQLPASHLSQTTFLVPNTTSHPAMWRLKARLDELWCEKGNERSVRQRRVATDSDDDEGWIEIRKVDGKDDWTQSAQAHSHLSHAQSQDRDGQGDTHIPDRGTNRERDFQLERSRGILKASIPEPQKR
ncbi:hypothetical protein K431DRAFT_292610 [Polychaeton citri CBS 116435]|uniref:Uncharacterized protein n=1 Tax=Polychaeton citri CBS 116435 TaxID=1314669 RepID=A0A9P4Q9Q2_9PEZI|nr:hypothetical protein K431DRAFT_292610 [Polychaeton citri CBS 116435]